jgi:aspartate ammonia-lyase
MEGQRDAQPPEFREEFDSLGSVQVPAGALYGAQTARAVANFPLAGQACLGAFPEVVRALLITKVAAARANASVGALDPTIANAIESAATIVMDGGDFESHFPVHHLHGGGGTSANMNVNEVLANVAEEVLGGARGRYELVDPLDHVNLHQSTNDVYPTAIHLAVLRRWDGLRSALEEVTDELRGCVERFGSEPRLARTCLQDAIAITFGDLLGGYAAAVERGTARIGQAVDELHRVSIGGTVVGRVEDVPDGYLPAVLAALRSLESPRLRHPESFYDAAQNVDDLVAVSSALDSLGGSLAKISKDIRLLASGPEAGLGEISIPAVQPGSSAMPFKINPVIPEFVIQLAWRISGNHRMATLAHEHGELDLNVWESALAYPLLDSMNSLEGAAKALARRCLSGLEPVVERNRRNAVSIIPWITELKRTHGYSVLSDLVRRANGDVDLLRSHLVERFDPRTGDDPGGR